MKKINGHFCRCYGNDHTHIYLTDKAQALYDQTDPMHIWEWEDEDADGETIYLYTITETYERGDGKWMTEDELNEYLEGIADEEAEFVAMNYLWTIDSWGSEYPPENADEIINEANDLIVQFAKKRKWNYEYEIERYADQLWERFCSTGKVQ